MDDLRSELRRLTKPRAVQLQDIRPTIAFDGAFWLNSLGATDSYMRLLGGLPPCLEFKMKEYVNKLKELGPKPIFVFEGLQYIQETNQHSLNKRQNSNKTMWEAVRNNRLDNSLPRAQSFSEDYSAEIFAVLKSCGAECFRAPYKVTMQLAYLSANSLVGAVFGDYDLLMYDVKKVIVEIDLDRAQALCLEGAAAITELQLTHDRLLDLFVLKGYCSGKDLTRDDPKKLLEQLKSRDGYSFLLPGANDSLKAFEIGKNFAKSQIVTKPDKPETVPLHPQIKLEAAIGLRFDNEVYFAVVVTPLSFQLLSAITSHRVVELPPVADSHYYRVALEKVMKVRENCYNLLLSYLNEAFRKSEIIVQYWHGETREIAFREEPRLKWVFTRAEVEQQITVQGRQMDLVFCLKWHYDAWSAGVASPLIANLKIDEAIEPQADSHKDVLCRVFFKFLEMCNFIGPGGEPMVFGKALVKSAGEFQHEMFIILEMLGMGLLNGRTMTLKNISYLDKDCFRALTACPEAKNPEHRHSVVLISRICSLLQPKFGNGQWTGPIDFTTAQFYSITRLLFRNYRLLLEAIIVSEFCNKRFSSPELFRGLGEKLPYRSVPCSALGVVLRSLLLGKSLDEVQQMYPLFLDLPGDLERCWRLWNCVLIAVKCLRKHESIKEKTYQEYIRAHEVFKARYEELLPGREPA